MGFAPQLQGSVDGEYLKMIQTVVARMAQNSFQAKSWSVTVVAAILALTSRSAQASACALALFPAFCFWVLDAYYLREERLFRALYDAAVGGKVANYNMSTSAYDSAVPSCAATMFAPAVLLVHVIIVAVAALVIITVLALG